ncbi:MAG TPA: serine/threonine-protein kinase [Gemmataceae bacterium]|jgi:serine/threonine protein kinase
MNPSLSLGREEASNPVLDELIAEITDKLHAGETVDVETYAAAHPDQAEELRRLLPALEMLAVAASSPGSEAASAEERREPPLRGELGDFRLLREVGRGGMGVVYEAEQISLRRRVALKVLPFAATMDPRHLQRFHNEAQAAACLHHTNIVPVFSVGCERGVHFYAMQFIDGQPLSDLIRQLRGREKTVSLPVGEARTAAYQPAPGDAVTPPPVAEMTPLTGEGRRGHDYFRKVAELGAQAAEALDHAHQLGIVHRDIKPANLLVDGRGNLWVTDFGLAQVRQSECHLTVTGQMVGTPRYMSPEQALAQRVPIDHRTDVYSLGATLYELLALRPAFESEDRQELLRQITFDDPAKPRRRERAISAELEIIVLKAMEKRPQDRYATAQEMADDLRRWLLDQPIRARRPGMVQRAVKWGRRHRPLVVAAVLCLLLALVLLAISNVVIWHEHEETKAALLKARIHEQEVSSLVDRERRFRDEFEVKLQRSLEAMDRTLTLLEEPFPEEGSETVRRYKAVSENALKFYQVVLPIETHRLSLRWEMMWAYVRLGNLYALHNQFDEAQQAYNKVESTAAELCNSREIMVPSIPAFEPRDRPAIEKVYRRALTHWRKSFPKTFCSLELDRSTFVRGSLMGNPTPTSIIWLGSHNDYRITIQALLSGWNKNEHPSALWEHMSLWERIRVLERIVEDLPFLSYERQLLGLRIQYGKDLHKAGRVEEAKTVFRQAVKAAEKGVRNTVSAKDTWVSEIPHLATMLLQLGCNLDNLGMSAEAESAIRVGLGFNEQLVCGTHRELYLARNMKRLVDHDGKLSALFSGQRQPADNTERLGLAWMNQRYKYRYAAAVRLYSEAFADEPNLANDLTTHYRYNAACAAALAGGGKVKDADKLDTKERAGLRQQALDWLRADLKAYRQVMDKSTDKAGPEIAQLMEHSIRQGYFHSPVKLAVLLEAEVESQQWEQLWQEKKWKEVESALSRQEAGTTTTAVPTVTQSMEALVVNGVWPAGMTKSPDDGNQPQRKEGSPGKD